MTTIALAGGTGNLGTRIARALVGRGAHVKALTRAGTAPDKVRALEALGVTIATVDLARTDEVARACKGAACLVSTLQGLADVIVDAQTVLLDGAQAAGVPRFIPSDFSIDIGRVPPGENRNFDLRRSFHARLDASPLRATSIYNGAFAELLTWGTPVFDGKQKTVRYGGDDPDWKLDFTTMDDTAAYTAAAALDDATPRALAIASFQVSPNDLVAFTRDVLGDPYRLVRMGSLDELAAAIQRERKEHPEGEEQVFPGWQQKMYIHSMFRAHHERLDNGRYPDVEWTPLAGVMGKKGRGEKE